MKSLLLKKYGDIGKALSFSEIDKPIPNDNEVLIEVKAIALNPIDIKIAKGDLKAILPSIVKKPKLGFDICGIIRKTGSMVTSFKNGEEVFSRLPLHKGSGFAEFVLADPDHVASKPKNITHEAAATIPLAALTCIQAISKYAKAKAGQSILIDSGSGGVGTFAIQYAKSLGLNITAVTSHKNEVLVEILGANRVICYDFESFLDDGEKYDIVFNLIGDNNPLRSILAAKKGGTVVSIGGPPDIRFVLKLKINIIHKLLLYPLFGLMSLPIKILALVKGVNYYRFLTESDGKQLEIVKGLIEKGKIKPIIDRTYPLEKYEEAFEYLKTNRVKGKLVLNKIY
ncbi:NAD(P)-dependent alcohol dehydrogenase [Flavobacteriaceae bacterium 3-367]|uniref:NAD(P)-dependent alcohol dehydrogenase n=1 Tax=Eudoraea algarum TaxID=3417568 RepID=UPI00328C8A9D